MSMTHARRGMQIGTSTSNFHFKDVNLEGMIVVDEPNAKDINLRLDISYPDKFAAYHNVISEHLYLDRDKVKKLIEFLFEMWEAMESEK